MGESSEDELWSDIEREIDEFKKKVELGKADGYFWNMYFNLLRSNRLMFAGINKAFITGDMAHMLNGIYQENRFNCIYGNRANSGGAQTINFIEVVLAYSCNDYKLLERIMPFEAGPASSGYSAPYYNMVYAMTYHDDEVGKKALDFLVANSGSRRNLEVDFFGGEPLMNWKVVKELVAYGRELEKQYDKHFRFTLTTNGVLLNEEVQEFVNREMDNVVLSLDGRKEVNDRMRPFRNGKGSYDLIVPKFQKLAESRDQQKYYIRGTFTRNNLDFSKDVEHFADLGFEQVSIEPVVGEDTDPYAIQKDDLPQIFEEYDRLAKMIIDREKSGRGFNFFHFMIDLEGGPCVSKRLSGCGSGTEYLAVTPWGDLYPCHQFVGQEEFLMGNVDEGIVKPEIAEEFRGCSVYSKESCKTCFARFYCSGGCMANSYKFHHTINDTYEVSCEMERKRVECAIMIKAALADK